MNEFKPLFRNRNFLYLLSSQVLSQLTINVMNFILLVRIFENTHSSIATSLLWVSYALPAIFLGPFAAASVDIFSKRKMLIVTNLLQSLVILGYAFEHGISVFLLYGVAFGYSLINQFYVPAEQSSLPALVKEDLFPYANSLFFITQEASLVLGFGVAGVLLDVLGFNLSLFVCAVLLFIAFVSVIFLPEMENKKDKAINFEQGFSSFFDKILEGYRFIKNQKSVLTSFLLLLSIQVLLAIITVNIPVIATELFRVNLANAGQVLVVPAGLGAAAAGLLTPKLLQKGIRKIRIIKISFLVTTFSSLVITFLVPTLNNDFLRVSIAIISIFALGASIVGIIIPSQTFLQEETPEDLRGRVFGNFWFLVTIATILPVILSGTIIELLGVRFLTILIGLLSFFALLFINKKGTNFIKGFEKTVE